MDSSSRQRTGYVQLSLISTLPATESYGALNLYSHRINAYDSKDMAVGLALASHIAIALARNRHDERREVALVAEAVIGQAENLLVERFNLPVKEAHDCLLRVCEANNITLIEVATTLVLDGHSLTVAKAVADQPDESG
jgi:hypothetical protein